MRYTLFGNSGMHVSRLSLGTMTFGSRMDQETSGRVIDEALDRGVNLIDTADSYGDSEACIGHHLGPEKRDRVFLVSKVYRQICRDGRAARNSRVNILHNVERSLERLRTSHLDLLLLHHPDPDTPVEQTLHTLDTLVQQGKIRCWGVSNHYAWQMAYMLGITRERHLEPMVCVQSNYSILERPIEREIVPMLERFQIALMCYSPLAGGILTGKYHPESGEPEQGRAQRMEKLQRRIEDQQVADLIAALRPLARDQGLSLSQLAVAWLLSKPHATTVILGGTSPEHFSSLYEIADHELPEDLVRRIDELSGSRAFVEFMNQPQRPGPLVNVNT